LYTRSGSFSSGLAAMKFAAFAAGLLILLIPHRPRVYIAEPKPIGALLADPTTSPDAIELGGIEKASIGNPRGCEGALTLEVS
jgi:hypothetical protein